MRNLIFLSAVLFVSFGSINAQSIPGVPNGSVGKDTRDDYDNGIRIRSMELERIKKESYRSAAAAKSAEKRSINYSQIKKDFEMVQKLQNEIIKTYVTGEQINYKKIGELAVKLNECANRLDENLSLNEGKTSDKVTKKKAAPGDVKDTIVDLDKTIGRFIASSVFKNLNIVETKEVETAKTELQNIISLSKLLSEKAGKHR